MSSPEEIQSEPAAPGLGESQPAAGTMGLARSVEQLRVLVCGLGVGLVVVSVIVSAFVFKQNRNLAGATAARQRQLSQLQVTEQAMDYAVGELAKYSNGKPELIALLAKRGIQVTPPSPASQPFTAPSH